MTMAGCSENHQLDLMRLIDMKRSIWTGTMRSQSGCAHPVMARLITASPPMPDALEKEIQDLRIKSQWLAHVCPFYGLAPVDSHKIFLLTQQYNESLQEKMQCGSLTTQEIQRYGTNIVCGVGVLHSADIVCGDIEPSTIFLDENGSAHIYVITPIEKVICVDDSSLGDNYAAPETWKSSNKVGNLFSKTSDVWSIGCILLKMCTGKSLWDGLSSMEILEYANQNILPLHLDELQGPLSNLICECLQYDAEKRPKLHQVQEKFLSIRQHVCPHPNPLRIRKLQTSDTESGGGGSGGGGDEDYGEDDSQERDCISACKEGLLEDLEKLLQKETGVIVEGAQALCLAISLKQLHEKEGRPGKAIVESLIKNGIDPSCVDDKGQTPLHIAASMSDIELLQILINAKADVNKGNTQNETPLHVALKSCAGLECIDCLIKKGANYRLLDNDGNSALHIAAQSAWRCKNLDALFAMINLGASPGAVNANFRGYSLQDLLLRLPTDMTSQVQKMTLAMQGILLETSLEGESESPHREPGALALDNLDDAYMAGGDNSLECTLIITEGRSAAQFAANGRDILGKNMYGSYTLTGKVKNMDGKLNENNKVSESIFTALGLKYSVINGKKTRYVFDKESLRYGHILMIMDQDSDGNHIRGLLINLFLLLCPEILKTPYFLQDFRTYLYKVTNVKTKETKSFRSKNDYQAWSVGVEQNEWTTKYFKGISTNSDDEVKQYFQNPEEFIRYFVWEGDIDSNYIHRAFDSGATYVRKKWVLEYEAGLYDNSPISSDKMISYHQFIRKEVVPYFCEDNIRSFPSIMDGFKISQRKIIFTVREKDGAEGDPMVRDLASTVAQCTSYHHGINSLQLAIISMAQDFCGTNNLNLLTPDAQFGSRNAGPNTSRRACEYLPVGISPLVHLIFPKEDDEFLEYEMEDGKVVQPKWYAPIFPLLLVNGCIGIGSGFNSYVLSYDVNHIIRNLERLMEGMPTEEMVPSYRDFKGSVVKVKDGFYATIGKWELDDDRTTLTVTELPVGLWGIKFEKKLKKLKKHNEIKSFEIIDKSPNGEAVHWYKIILSRAMDDNKIQTKFRLKRTHISSMYLLNAQGCVRYYSSPNKVLNEFYIERLKIYERRKERMMQETSAVDLWKKDLQEFKDAYLKINV